GDLTTRWSRAFSDPQWLKIDRKSAVPGSRVELRWENASSSDYDVQISSDGTVFNNLYTDSAGNGGVADIGGPTGTGRYLRIYSRSRNTAYGNSLFEVEVYSSPASCPVGCASDPLTPMGALASSTEQAAFPASDAIDGDLATRWSSAFSDPQWLK